MKLTIAALCALLILGSTRVLAHEEPFLAVLSIGQGAAVMLAEGSTQILYDTGPDGIILEALARHMPAWDQTLELLIISHLHTDHIGGADEILTRFHVKEVWWNGASAEGAAITSFTNSLGQVPQVHPLAGFHAVVGGFRLEVLHPIEGRAGQVLKHAHNGTLVVRATAKGRSALLTGDLEKEHVRSLLTACVEPCEQLRSDVLMLSHHGSRNATSAKLLDAVHPSLAFICVGQKNRYRHPHSETLELVSERNIPLHRTDLDGDLVVVFRPSGIVWQQSTGPPL